MNRRNLWCCFVLAITLLPLAGRIGAQEPAPITSGPAPITSGPAASSPGQEDSALENVQKILEEIKQNNELMANLEYLTDMIGPRLTGTEKMNQASQWTMEMFRKYGLANAHVEPWTVARAWQRGTARAGIISPVEQSLTVAALGWSPSTAGLLRGGVVYVNARRVEELQPYKGKLRAQS